MRHRLIAVLAGLALSASATPAGASIPLGQVPALPTGDCGADFDFVQQTVAAGTSYIAPEAGRITSWSTNAGVGAGPGQQYTMKVFRQLAGSSYSVVGHDGPRTLVESGLSTFASNVPVKAGDQLGIHVTTAGTNCIALTSLAGDTHFYRGTSDLADGAYGDFAQDSGKRLNIAAELVPANTITLGKPERNKKKGTATLAVTVPNPGEIVLSGKGVKTAGAASIAKTVPAGVVTLLIKAKGKKQKTLNETGTVKVNPKITYTPTAGDPNTQSVKLKLKKL
jgi:hypothetical protein